MRLCTTFNIECSHTVEEPLGPPRLHGHSYVITVCTNTSEATPQPLPQLEACASQLKDMLDHRHLNDLLDVPTMEAIAAFVRQAWTGPDVVAVRVARPTIGASVEWEA